MNIQIRHAEAHDLPLLKNLMLQYIVDFYKRPRPSDKDLEELIMMLLENPSAGDQFVAEHNNELIGFSTLYYTFSTTRVKKIAILNDLFIHCNHRASGIGEAIFTVSKERAAANGCANLSWQTAADNTIAQSLYEKMGGKNANDQWFHYELNL